MHADYHRRRQVGRLEIFAPSREQLSITTEHYGLRAAGRKVNRDLPAPVVIERLSDKVPCDAICSGRFRNSFGAAIICRRFANRCHFDFLSCRLRRVTQRWRVKDGACTGIGPAVFARQSKPGFDR